jgi:hypothetical protein
MLQNGTAGNFNAEIKYYKKIGLFKMPDNSILNLLRLKNNEKILINLKIFPFRSIFKNDIRERHAQFLILTNDRILIIRKDISISDIILFDDLTNLIISKKWLMTADLPVISIKTSTDLFDIYFYKIAPYKKKIEGIISCIQQRNPKISIENNLKEDNLIKNILFSKIKFK